MAGGWWYPGGGFPGLGPLGASGIIVSVSPGVAIRGFTAVIDIVGQGTSWVDGVTTVAFDGGDITTVLVTVIDDEHLTAYISIGSGASLSLRGVTVDTSGIEESESDVLRIAAAGAVATLKNAFQYTLLIRGEDIRRNPSVQISESLGNSPNVCTFTLDGSSPIPRASEEVEIRDSFDSDRLLFAGVVQNVVTEFDEQPNQLVWRVTATDYTFWLNRKRPFGYYNRESASLIVLDLVARYAPWVDTSFVQTQLCKITASFDGSKDFATCLTIIARQIGSGQWYLDYEKRLHFFHVIPTNEPSPLEPESVILDESEDGDTPSPGTAGAPAMIASNVDASNVTSHTPHWAIYQVVYRYSNQTESGLGKISVPIWRPGRQNVRLEDIPVGEPVGGLTVVGRNIYATQHTQFGSSFLPVYLVSGNSTTELEFQPGRSGASPVTGMPIRPVVTPPAAPSGQMSVSFSGLTHAQTYAAMGHGYYESHGYTITPGIYQFAVSCVYEDGTESLPSKWTNPIEVSSGDSDKGFKLSQIPVGADVNGLSVVYRKVYVTFSATGTPNAGLTNTAALAGGVIVPGRTTGAWLIPNNSDTEENISTGFTLREAGSEEATSPSGPPGLGQTIFDPCTDGPYLEDSLPQPDDIDSDSETLQHDPQINYTTDVSQIRNRIYVRGAGTVTTQAAAIGDLVLRVADAAGLPPNGGLVTIGTLGMTGQVQRMSAVSGPATITLKSGIVQALDSGSPIRGTIVVNHAQSQRLIGRLELDENGDPTDGVHEYFIDDPTLITISQQVARGNAELELFAMPQITVHYSTRDPNTHPGRVVNIDLVDPPISGEFLIQSVSVDQIHDESDQITPRYNAQASNVRFNLEDLLILISDSLSNPGNFSVGGANPAGIVEQAEATSIEISGELSDDLYTRIYKETDEDHGSSSTYAPDDDLIIPFPAGKMVHFRGRALLYSTGDGFTGGMKVRLNALSGTIGGSVFPTYEKFFVRSEGGVTLLGGTSFDRVTPCGAQSGATNTVGGGGNNPIGYFYFEGFYHNETGADKALTIEYASVGGSSWNAVVLKGSWVEFIETYPRTEEGES